MYRKIVRGEKKRPKNEIKPRKVKGAITTNRLRTEANRERWDNKPFRVLAKDGNGTEFAVDGFFNDRDAFVISLVPLVDGDAPVEEGFGEQG